MSQDKLTDLTGTYIEANKPIAVVSGHTKAAFPRFQFTFLGRNGGFMRNMLAEMVLPIELLGTEYVSAPLLYQDRPRGKLTDDKGDLIRFVATDDGTTISQQRKDGSGMLQISPVLNRGQYYDIVNQEDAAYYQSNKKVLLAQFGKQWWSYAVTPGMKADEDIPNNPSRNGQGILLTLIPMDHWSSYAVWRAPAEIDDFIYITFHKDHQNYIKIDQKPLIEKFSTQIKQIPGTDYYYVTGTIAAGDHLIIGDTIPSTKGKQRAKFAVYAYGNWDRSKDGFAYGYPVGIDYTSPCDDSLIVKDTMICGDVFGTAEVLPSNLDCAVIYNILESELDNYEFKTDPIFKPGDSKRLTYYLNVINPKKSASASIKVQTKSGLMESRKYEYWPEEIKYDSTIVDFGQLLAGDKKTLTFDIVNSSSKVITNVRRLYLKDNKPEFTINEKSTKYPLSFPFSLKPGEKKTVEVIANAPVYTKSVVRDYVIAELTCYEFSQVELKYKMTDPVVWIADGSWQSIHVGNLVSQQIKIINRSDVDVILNSINWPDSDKVVFPKVEGLPCWSNGGTFTSPLTLQPYGEFTFLTYFKPDKAGVFETRAVFTANTTKDKLYSTWSGNAYTDIDYSMNDENIEFFNNQIIINIDGDVKSQFNMYDILGRRLDEKSPVSSTDEQLIYDISELGPGLYIIQYGNSIRKIIKI
jgi:hypothetical protein